MKFFSIFKIFLLISLTTTFTIGSPIVEGDDVVRINKKEKGVFSLDKRGFIINYIKQKINDKQENKSNTSIDSGNHKDIKKNLHYTGLKKLDIYYDKQDLDNRKPVVLYVCGSLTYSCDKNSYTQLGNFLSDNGYVGIIPNYVQFPFGTINDMMDDLSEALFWIYKHVDKYGGDRDNVILVGHSSGAHISALMLIESSLGIVDQSGYGAPALPPLKKAILLNGIYDFDIYSSTARKTGRIPEKSKTEALAKIILSSDKSSPTDLLKPYSDKSINYLTAGSFALVHSNRDNSVPVESANGLMYQIRRSSRVPADVYIAPGFTHTGFVNGVMEGDSKAQKYFMDLLTN